MPTFLTGNVSYEFAQFPEDLQNDVTLAGFGFDTTNGQFSNGVDLAGSSTGTSTDFNVTQIDTTHGGDGDRFAIRYTTEITVTTAGTYTFHLVSDDASGVYVDDQLVSLEDGVVNIDHSGSIDLTAGTHTVSIVYMENDGSESLAATVSGPDTSDVAVDLSSVTPGFTSGNLDYQYIDYSGPLTLAGAGFDTSNGTFNGITPTHTGTATNFDVSTLASTLTPGDLDSFVARYTVEINVTNAGDYTLGVNSDDGSAIFVDGVQVAIFDNLHGLDGFQDGTINLSSGLHEITIIYFERNAGEGLQAHISGPDTGDSFVSLADQVDAVCFAAGTLISTPSGEVKVEDLKIGDLVRTAEGEAVDVKWVGIQTLNPARVPCRDRLQLVQIERGALGDGLPHSDLSVTGDHGMVLDNYVINAGALVNHVTIYWAPINNQAPQFKVYHVETQNHDVILANGAPSETFVDVVGRRAFDNYQEYLELYGFERIIPELHMPRISSHRLLPTKLKDGLAMPKENEWECIQPPLK